MESTEQVQPAAGQAPAEEYTPVTLTA